MSEETDYEFDRERADVGYYDSPNDRAHDIGQLIEEQEIEEERQVKKMEETKGYPKFQWSIFVKNGKDQQFVIRADTIEEFKQAKSDVLALIGETVVNDGPVRTTPAQPVEAQPSQENIHGKCPKCGAWNVKNPKNGNIFCKDKCWLK